MVNPITGVSLGCEYVAGEYDMDGNNVVNTIIVDLLVIRILIQWLAEDNEQGE